MTISVGGTCSLRPSSEVLAWTLEQCVLGIDEAGRGPVLGPMVYGCAYCTASDLPRIAKLEFADSKTLNEAKREEFYKKICEDERMGWAVDAIQPEDLSAQMLSRQRCSLNVISQESAAGLIRTVLSRGVNLQQVFVDTVGDADKYASWLSSEFPGLQFTVCKKADSIYPIVSAASIIAKVTRDRALEGWVMKEEGSIPIGRRFGCGYPGDEDTKAWLQEHKSPVFGFPSLVRFSWATCKTVLDESCVPVFWEGEEQADSEVPDRHRKRNRAEFESSAAQRHAYFRTRQLQRVEIRL